MNINSIKSTNNTQETIDSLKEASLYLRNKIAYGVDTADEEELRKEMEAKILRKLKAGKRLTSEEMQYLKQYNPELYIHAVRIEVKRRSLEEQLKHARSKEEVADIQIMAMGSVSKKDPVKEYMVAAIQETVSAFKETADYKRLPERTEEGQKTRTNKIRNSSDEEDNTGITVNYEFTLGHYQMAFAESSSASSVGFISSI